MKIVDMTDPLNLSYQLFYFLRPISLYFGESPAFPVLQAPVFILSDCHIPAPSLKMIYFLRCFPLGGCRSMHPDQRRSLRPAG